MDVIFSGAQTSGNIYRLHGKESDQVARGDTINYYLKLLPTKHICNLLDKMVFHFLKNKCIECYRESLANTLLIGADETGLRSTKILISHSTIKNHHDGKFCISYRKDTIKKSDKKIKNIFESVKYDKKEILLLRLTIR